MVFHDNCFEHIYLLEFGKKLQNVVSSLVMNLPIIESVARWIIRKSVKKALSRGSLRLGNGYFCQAWQWIVYLHPLLVQVTWVVRYFY